MISINYINKRDTRKIYGIAGALLTLAIPYFIMLYGNGNIETEQSLCPFKMITGLPCPGCGITKSLIFLYEGNLSKSFYYHLFGPFTFLFCIAAIVILALELITHKEYFRNILFNNKVAYTLGAALAIYHFTRLVIFLSANSMDDILHQSIWK
ncbi:MAG TPA: DUF2752 domain-containing protein [Chitinophagaceae bacterium]|nr:DUF2752 domain-containing protein [Chitinophagaceae bacterium]